MADVPITITDRVVEHPMRFTLTDTDTGQVLGTFDLTRKPGEIASAGDLIGKALLEAIQAALTDYATAKDTEYANKRLPSTFQKIITGGFR